MPKRVVDLFQAVDIDRKGGQIRGQRSRLVEFLERVVIGKAAEHARQRIGVKLDLLAFQVIVHRLRAEFHIVDKNQSSAEGQRDIRGADLPVRELLHQYADDHQQ